MGPPCTPPIRNSRRRNSTPDTVMASFLRAAFEILSERKAPMSSDEITKEALRSGLLQTVGVTPAETMRSRLSTDILRRKERSPFMRTEAGAFALRSWGLEEYVAPRFTKSLFDEDVVVFPASRLREFVPSNGLYKETIDSRHLLSICTPMRRRLAEDSFEVIQLISLFLVRYRDCYLTHKRAKRLPESRLHGFYSITFGGHLNPDDLAHFQPLFDPLGPNTGHIYLDRELHEELRTIGRPDIIYRGLLYDESREVSRQHLGIVFDVELASPEFTIGERGFLTDPKFETLDQVFARIDEFENWSVLIAQDEHLARSKAK